MSGVKQLLFLAVALSGTAWAQDSGLARWQAIRAHQPAGVSLQVSAAKNEFYSGELIPLQLSFTSTQHDEFLADSRFEDRAGHLSEEEFLVDPAVLAEDPLR